MKSAQLFIVAIILGAALAIPVPEENSGKTTGKSYHNFIWSWYLIELILITGQNLN